MEEIQLTSGPHRLAATLVRGVTAADAGAPAILFVHGLRSDRSGYVARARRAAEELGATCLALDLTGHGSSTGEVTEVSPNEHVEDLAAAYDHLRGLPEVDPARVGVCGASYGACLAVLLTGRRDVARLMLRAPTIVADADLVRPLADRTRSRDAAVAPTLFETLRAFRRPVQVVESELDEVIPHHVVEEYLSTAPSVSHRVIGGATHSLSQAGWRATFEHLILEFFAPL